MKIFANNLNATYLRDVLPTDDIDIDWVKAAIAYGNDSRTLIDNCLTNKFRLDIWMRYDHTVPVAPRLLRKLLQNMRNNIFCRLVPDVLHAKVIWWKNYGVYIGSANLTDRGWVSNIEFGIFLNESELESGGALEDIEVFFDALADSEQSFDLTEEIIEDQEKLLGRRSRITEIDKESEKNRLLAKWDGPTFFPESKPAYDHRKSSFIREWQNGLSVLREIAQRAPEFRPRWLSENVPAAWQADQFLHAYYYNKVVEGKRHPYEEHYNRNQTNPIKATEEALLWWSLLNEPPSDEDENCQVKAPIILKLLAPNHIEDLSLDDFIKVCQANHSTVDHVKRMSLETLGLLDQAGHSLNERVATFGSWLWKKRNEHGEDIKDVLRFVFDGGTPENMPSRLFEASNQWQKKLPHFGTNQLAELAGWARPELYPPRNGRTSKSLRALGYDVRIY